jgi:hypothetical protein
MGNPSRPQSAAEVKVLEELRKIFARLPGVTEARDGFGHSTFKVGKKSLAMLGEDNGVPSLGLKTDVHTQALLIKRGDFVRTPYVGQHGWISANGTIKDIDWPTVEEVVRDAYRAVAPKKLLAQLKD